MFYLRNNEEYFYINNKLYDQVNEKYTICLDGPTEFSKDFEIDSRDDTCHSSKVVMFFF